MMEDWYCLKECRLGEGPRPTLNTAPRGARSPAHTPTQALIISHQDVLCASLLSSLEVGQGQCLFGHCILG